MPQASLEYVEDSKKVFKLCDGAYTIERVQAVRVLAKVNRVFYRGHGSVNRGLEVVAKALAGSIKVMKVPADDLKVLVEAMMMLIEAVRVPVEAARLSIEAMTDL